MAHRYQQSTLPQQNTSFFLASTHNSNAKTLKSARKDQASQDTILLHNENTNPLTGSIISTKQHRASRNLAKNTPLKSEDKLSLKISQVKNAIEAYREYKSESSMSNSHIQDCSKINLNEDQPPNESFINVR
jgi:hypothetical protein